ncbi:hypothetical protein [Mycoplasma sp. E35C]|uniref:hypothetical protein n=1 Tax=Mycoplasma sp. E35C TaxID=2801918 RepID=UPI001CA3CD14|nr:hypothetical protein [Mycoplasma sp. E35C]QZX49264.1 hypothetical protein JJE79_00655 [Mycoplasma sp. E35C]
MNDNLSHKSKELKLDSVSEVSKYQNSKIKAGLDWFSASLIFLLTMIGIFLGISFACLVIIYAS